MEPRPGFEPGTSSAGSPEAFTSEALHQAELPGPPPEISHDFLSFLAYAQRSAHCSVDKALRVVSSQL